MKPPASREINPRSSDLYLDFAETKPLDFTGRNRGSNGRWTKWFRMVHLTAFLCAAHQNGDGRPSDGTVGPSAAFGIADILNGTVGRITGHARKKRGAPPIQSRYPVDWMVSFQSSSYWRSELMPQASRAATWMPLVVVVFVNH